ncbi:MAG: peptidylprolyl isomerase [Elusimicrobia bacterium]|nr:peptidylprolyl isomerase [Elusimicrobiota bacterium]
MKILRSNLSAKKTDYISLLWIFVFLSFSFFLFGCSNKSEKVLAKVGSEKITLSEFQQMLQSAPPNLQDYLSTDIGRKQYLDALLKEKMVLIAAKKQGIQNRPAVKKNLAELEKRLKDNYIKLKDETLVDEFVKEKTALGDTEVKDYYEKHKDDFENPSELKVSHILLPTENDAKNILERIKKGEDFQKLAKELSIDKMTAQKGGDLGFFGKRQYVKEFEDAAYNIKKIGDVSDVVKTPLGFHIIKLTDKKQLKAKKLEEVETEIKQVIQKEKLDKWMEDISKQYKPEINYELLSKNFGQENKLNNTSK